MASAIIFLAIRNTEREREHIAQNLLDRADALIWALEAATRAGMQFDEEEKLLQPIVTETARQRGILYIAIVDANGLILAHSDPQKNGQTLPQNKLPSSEPPQGISWNRLHSLDSNVYEVYREFAPAPGYHHRASGKHGGNRHGQQKAPPASGAPSWQEDQELRSFALVGFDKKPYEEMLAKDRTSNLTTAFVAAALGLGSLFSLFWAHSYQRSRRKLKNTSAMAAEVVTSLPVGLIACSHCGIVSTINATALSMLRVTRDQTVGLPLYDIMGLDWHLLIASISQTKKVIEREMELNLYGVSTSISLSASQIRDEDGLFLGHLFILRDITEIKRLQGEAQRNDKLRALGSLAAGVAHEIRNPLSSIKGLATYLAEKIKPSSPAEEEAAKTMIIEVDRLNRVVSQLLEFARPTPMKLAATDLNAVITRTLRLADADIRAKNIHVSFTPDGELPHIHLNTERFTQALLNLFLNAIQAMDPGGTLSIQIRVMDKSGILEIAVKDNGRGIPQEIQSSIFTPYFTTKASGTGLGLAIVQQIIEGHGGSISVKSAPETGSVFTVLLPAPKQHENKI